MTAPYRTHSFCFNRGDNGGESFILFTKISEDQISQEFHLNSYCNAMTLEINGEMIPPEQLRDLANQLDRKYAQLCAQRVAIGSQDKKIGEHRYLFNPKNKAGWVSDQNNLFLLTEYFDNGDGVPNGIYINQKLCFKVRNQCASFVLCGTSIEPETLRKLANELDSLLAKLEAKEEVAQ